MKKIYSYFLCIVCFFISSIAIKAQAFTIGSPSGNYSLNCITTAITMTANSGTTPYSYTWTVPGSTINGVFANVALPGTWTVTGQNLTTSVTTQQTFAVGQSAQVPTIAITPTIQNMTCVSGAVCFTLTSNLGPNVTTNWFMVQGTNTVYVGAAQGTININCFGQPGVYWGESVNNITGCKSTKSVQVTASVGVPAFTVTSPTNFTIGCASTSITSMQVTMVVTSPIANAPCQYTFVPPATTGTPTTFTMNPNQNGIIVPGAWVVYVRDLTNNCVSSQSISIIQNTVGPNIYHIQPLSVLDCNNPSMVLTGMSNNPNTTVTWTVPSIPTNSVNPTPIQTVNINPSITNSSVMLTSLGYYTVGASDNINQCKTTFTMQLIQDIRKPVFTIAALTNSIINCINPDVVLVPIITPSLAVSLVPTFIWYPPVSGAFPGSQFNTTSAGSHTATSASSVNGCTTSATYVVAIDNQVGVIGGILAISCPVTTVAISPTITTNPASITFSWSGAPGSITSAVNQSSISVNSLGTYTCIVTNTVNGCTDTIYCTAVCSTGLLNNKSFVNNISVYPNPSKGSLNIEVLFVDPNAKFSIYDTQGKLLLERPLNSERNKIEINLPKGYYLYGISSENQVLKKDKLIIE